MGRPILLLTLAMFLVVSIIQMSVNNRLLQLTERNVDYHSEGQAKNITASLMNYAISEIRRDQGWKGTDDEGYSSQNLLGGEGDLKVYDINDFLDPDVEVPPNSVPSWDIYTRLVYASATYNEHTVVTEVMLTQDSFSKYAYFSNDESGLWFVSDNALRGPVHSNDQFNIKGSPVFYGEVTTTAEENYLYPGAEPQFLGGIHFNSPEIQLPTDDQLNELRSAALNGGRKFYNPIEIELYPNGDIKITETIERRRGRDEEIEHTLNISDFNGVISSTDDINIKGTLNGQLTLHSEKDIEIMGDVVYAEDPREYENSDDMLGLVSEHNVVIDDDAHRDNGHSDITIHASIMALDQSFYVEDYDKGDPRGTLHLLGGIIQERRGPVGTHRRVDEKIIRVSGYSKEYEYDDRLLRMNPPSFPRKSFFDIYYWKDRLASTN